MNLWLLTALLALQEPARVPHPRLFDLNQGSLVKYQPHSIAFSPDGRWLAASPLWRRRESQMVFEVTLFNTETSEAPSYWKFEDPVHSLAFTRDSKYLVIGTCLRDPKSALNEEVFNGAVFFLELASNTKTYLRCKQHAGCISALEFSADGAFLATGGATDKGWSGKVGLHEVATRKGLGSWETRRSGIDRLVFSADGKLLAACGDDSILFVYDVVGRKQMCMLAGHTDGIVGLTFSPDNKRLVSVGNRDGLKWWDLATREFTSSAEVRSQAKCGVASPDGKVFWIANKTKQGYDLVRLDLTSGKTLSRLSLPLEEPIKWMAFSADGKILTTDGAEGRLYLWDITKFAEAKAGN